MTCTEQNAQILHRRTEAFNKHVGPRVGDWLELSDGSMLRFTHDWGDCIQTTCKGWGDSGSFYLGDGYASYSGSLDPAIPKAKLRDTGRTKQARFWFFSEDMWRAHNGIDVTVECRIFEQIP